MVMDDAASEFLDGLKACFAEMRDPRVVGRCDHLLLDILVITILAVFCGAEDWPDIELFGRARADWLRTFLELPNGIPSHDTFRRVLGALERNHFAACLFRWTQALHEATKGKLIAIDGKALRRSFAKKSGKAMLHLVTAWSSQNRLTLGQVAVEDKSNEITAIPELLKLLNLKGCTVTIDAMGTQTEIARQIREQKAHYVLALKGNQSGLQDDMQQLFDQATETDFAGMKHDVAESVETGHGRTDERTCYVIELPKDHPQRQIWKDLRTLALTLSRRVVNNQESWESRMYISSHPPRANMLATAIRQHWSIENSQHWILDVTFGEDARRQQDRNGAANLAAVRRLAVSLLRRETTNKRGAKNKRLNCALDLSYLLTVLHTAHF
jgi:predicted transposase YbfD/YdcC